ncbi:dimethyladenosine transferase [Streptomyces sp. SPB78]|nr:dimethyladenosine transferase [Streptomyces sp. SPB78]
MTRTDPLLGPADIRELAAALDVRPTKQRGQNFVIDANTVRRIVRTAEVRETDTVVEVGPGLGSLTLALLEVAADVTAVEIDDTLAAALPATVAARLPEKAAHFRLVHSDALRVRELPGPAPTALVANLPYNVAVPVLLHMLEHFPSVERTLVMVQAEVADRLAAPPGSRVYGVPSVKAAWYAHVKRAGSIGRSVFWPAPNVDSGLVSLVRARGAADHEREPPARSSRSWTRAFRAAPQGPAGPPPRPGGRVRRRRPRRRCAPAGVSPARRAASRFTRRGVRPHR